ncbi:hypothetical protein JYB64_09050 [Algoriphagus aestuarii]|nr:hypothetical protein [Algoriphagus aestuarii]
MKEQKRVNFFFRKADQRKWYSDFFLIFLKDRNELIIDEVAPSFVFHEAHLVDVLKYDCVRIAFAAENVRIDFNISDYGIGFDHLNFQDRYIRFPLYLLYSGATRMAEDRIHVIPKIDSNSLVNRKFCSFLVSNGAASEFRVRFFKELSKYKKVDSGGGFMNNVGGKVADKLSWQSEYKFSLCFENSSTSGYLTEKLIQAYAANTVPIYWGDPDAFGTLKEGKSGINPKAVIWVDESNMKQSIEHILELDSNEELYLSYLNEPLFLDEGHSKIFANKLEDFLCSIFRQNPENAYRRGFGLARMRIENRTKARSSIYTSFIKYLKKRLKS